MKKMLISYTVLSIVFIAFSYQGVLAGGPVKKLFIDAPISDEIIAKQEQAMLNLTIVRSRYVKISFDYLARKDGSGGEDTIILNLFDDVSLTAVKERFESRELGNRYTWFGRIEGMDHSQVIIVVENGSMAANITLPDGNYQVRSDGNGIHAIYKIDQSAFPDEAPPTPVDVEPKDTSEPSSSINADDGSTIDVMVVYTSDAASGGDILSEIQLAIDETNTSYGNSGINPRLDLVHTEQVTYTESGNIQTDRDRLQDPSDGYMDDVHSLRDANGADLISLWVANGGGYCGIAYIMESVSTTFENYAFSVVARNCATGYYSFGHEFGHIQSARHDWYVDPTNNSPYNYNHGYVDPGNAWRTIMAYSNACSGCSRIQYWSNPDVLYGSTPMGVSEGLYDAANNRKTLNNTAWTVANFRQSAVADPTPDIKANNVDGPITISSATPLYITVSLDPGGSVSQNADWWVLVKLQPGGWYHYKTNGWKYGQSVTYQGALYNVSSYEALNTTGLEAGFYKFYFAVDMIRNGSIDMGQIYYDSVDVNITP